MKEFLDIVSVIISQSSLKYDILLITDLITGLCINSKYKFCTYRFSEKICNKYNVKNHKGYAQVLSYYEKENALDYFFEYAKSEQILIEEHKQKGNIYNRLVFLVSEIEKRPGQYLTKWDLIHLKALLDGYFAGEDIKEESEIGTQQKKFEREFGEYIAIKYSLFEEREWYEKIDYVAIGFNKKVEEFARNLREFVETKE